MLNLKLKARKTEVLTNFKVRKPPLRATKKKSEISLHKGQKDVNSNELRIDKVDSKLGERRHTT